MKSVIRLFLRPFYFKLKQVFISAKYQIKNNTLKLGDNVTLTNVIFKEFNYVASSTVLNKCHLGSYSYIGEGSRLRDVAIGNFVSIGPNVSIGLGEHPTNRASTHPIFYSTQGQVGISFATENTFEEYRGTTTIGHDVWIGANVLIRGGLKIGTGAIIASGSVVVADVEPYSIVGGVPAKHIKYRLSSDQINILLKSEWWLKDESWLKENYKKLLL